MGQALKSRVVFVADFHPDVPLVRCYGVVDLVWVFCAFVHLSFIWCCYVRSLYGSSFPLLFFLWCCYARSLYGSSFLLLFFCGVVMFARFMTVVSLCWGFVMLAPCMAVVSLCCLFFGVVMFARFMAVVFLPCVCFLYVSGFPLLSFLPCCYVRSLYGSGYPKSGTSTCRSLVAAALYVPLFVTPMAELVLSGRCRRVDGVQCVSVWG